MAFAGRVVWSDDGGFPPGAKVAGYRSPHPLHADLILAHPCQVVRLPEDLDPRRGALVFHLALAREAWRRLRGDGPVVIVAGRGLAGDLIGAMAQGEGRVVQRLTETGGWCDVRETASRGGARLVLVHRDFLPEGVHGAVSVPALLVGLAAEAFPSTAWRSMADRWVGLPHAQVANVDVHSGLPLDLPPYLDSRGLALALEWLREERGGHGSPLPQEEVGAVCARGRMDLRLPLTLVAEASPGGSAAIVGSLPDEGKARTLRVGLIGLGMWARGNLVPILARDPRVRLVMAADQDPVRLLQGADLFRIPAISADPLEVCRHPGVDAVFITTWHDSHARLAAEALRAGKKVFVEKPLAVNREDIRLLEEVLSTRRDPFLAVGFNRVHSGVTHLLKRAIAEAGGRVTFSALVREPTIPPTHYYYWPRMGTRIAGNSCHWIDYAFHLLLPRRPTDIRVVAAAGGDAQDNNVIVMRYADGSLVSLTFANRGEDLINGDEHLELRVEGASYTVQDFRRCLRYAEGRVREVWSSPSDRGWRDEVAEVLEGMFNGRPPRPVEESLASAALVLGAVEDFRRQTSVAGESREAARGGNTPPTGGQEG
jgi:predicted dehydrogenase